jgi:hypothetical protein
MGNCFRKLSLVEVQFLEYIQDNRLENSKKLFVDSLDKKGLLSMTDSHSRRAIHIVF